MYVSVAATSGQRGKTSVSPPNVPVSVPVTGIYSTSSINSAAYKQCGLPGNIYVSPFFFSSCCVSHLPLVVCLSIAIVLVVALLFCFGCCLLCVVRCGCMGCGSLMMMVMHTSKYFYRGQEGCFVCLARCNNISFFYLLLLPF